ncbi:MAG: PIG-L family deacetylase [Bacteroidaceae bacterium]|nr:PIG-L family deacetylase [Bacteroidaceae bacterium]
MSKVLVVAVHPDDETLGCAGTILKHKEQGDEVYWMIITSIRNHPNGYPSEVVKKRDQTIKAVADAYDFNGVVELNIPTTLVDKSDLGSLVSKASKAIDDIKPDIVYMMHEHDVHSDHRVSFSVIYSCLKSFRHPFVKRIYTFESLSETEFAVATPSNTFIPNVFVDITDYIGKKLEIMSMYDTELMDEPYPRSLSSIKALARVRGSRAGVMYAEAFQLLYEKR